MRVIRVVFNIPFIVCNERIHEMELLRRKRNAMSPVSTGYVSSNRRVDQRNNLVTEIRERGGKKEEKNTPLLSKNGIETQDISCL